MKWKTGADQNQSKHQLGKDQSHHPGVNGGRRKIRHSLWVSIAVNKLSITQTLPRARMNYVISSAKGKWRSQTITEMHKESYSLPLYMTACYHVTKISYMTTRQTSFPDYNREMWLKALFVVVLPIVLSRSKLNLHVQFKSLLWGHCDLRAKANFTWRLRRLSVGQKISTLS